MHFAHRFFADDSKCIENGPNSEELIDENSQLLPEKRSSNIDDNGNYLISSQNENLTWSTRHLLFVVGLAALGILSALYVFVPFAGSSHTPVTSLASIIIMTKSTFAQPSSSPTTAPGSSLMGEAMSKPTLFPTEATPTRYFGVPTLFPTEATPIRNGLSRDVLDGPTLYPTQGVPTRYPTYPANVISTASPSYVPSLQPSESIFTVRENNGPTQYPTEGTPTQFPTIGNPASSSLPSPYPTQGEPTHYPSVGAEPTKTPDVYAPTLYPTAPLPTAYPSLSEPTAEPSDAVPTVPELEIVFKRDGYTKVDLHSSLMFYEFLKDYDAVIEPYATMVPEIVDLTSDERYYWFEICLEDEYEADLFNDCTSGNMTMEFIPSFQIQCEPYDRLSVKFIEYQTSNNEILRDAEGYAICMYVRREIRDLSSGDLNATMDAMYSMWAYEEEEGQELFGDKFHSNEYFVGFHYFNAAWQDSDHIHEGNGFLPQHIKITNMFEESMQAVNPMVTIPFWDFTIESAYDISIYDSYIMTGQVFGSMTLPTDVVFGFTYANDSILEGAIPDGRWAYTAANVNDRFDNFNFGYGYLRAPWNQNPNPYLTRYFSAMDITLPDCGSHYTALQQTDLVTFTETIEAGPHAKTHVKLGGIFGCDKLYTMYEAGLIKDLTTFKDMCGNWAFSLKEFYRDNFFIPNSNCTIDTNDINNSTCGYYCNDPDDTFITDIMSKFASSVPENMTRVDWQTWKEFICEGDGQKIIFGEHLESSSTSDPSFWPIHPTLERLLQAKLMAGGFVTMDWPTDPINQYVCDKSSCYSPDYDAFDNFTQCCEGHFEYSRLYDAASGNRSNYVGLTNGQVIAYTDPSSSGYGMPYIYADFTWPHCYETDHLTNFDALLVSMSEEYTRRPSSYPTSYPTVTMRPTAPTPIPSEDPTYTPTIKPTPTPIPTIPRPTEPPTQSAPPTHGFPTEPPTVTPPPTTTRNPTPGKPSSPPTATAVPVLPKPSFEPTLRPTPGSAAPTTASPFKFPSITIPTATAPTATAPTATAPTATAPTATAPTATAPTAIQPTATSPTGSTPSAVTPTGATPTGTTPTGATPTGGTPTGGTPTGGTPTGGTPTGATPTGGTPSAQTPANPGTQPTATTANAPSGATPTSQVPPSNSAAQPSAKVTSPTAHPTPGSAAPTSASPVKVPSTGGSFSKAGETDAEDEEKTEKATVVIPGVTTSSTEATSDANSAFWSQETISQSAPTPDPSRQQIESSASGQRSAPTVVVDQSEESKSRARRRLGSQRSL